MEAGQIVNIYLDWQQLDNFEGEGKLIRKISDGLPFILEESSSSRQQKIYSYETWLVETNGVRLVRKIRTLNKGKARYKREDRMSPASETSFISINGKQIY